MSDMPIKDLEPEELDVWGSHSNHYFWEVLSGEKSLETARDDILSFRNSEYYTGNNPDYQKLETQDKL